MRLLALVGLVGLLSGCGVDLNEQEGIPGSESELTQQAPPESWCRSYTTQKVCPKYICAWFTTATGGYCSLPAESVSSAIEEAPAAVESDSERTEMGPPESWCKSYKTQQYCPSVCFWYSYPAPGYCGLKSAQTE